MERQRWAECCPTAFGAGAAKPDVHLWARFWPETESQVWTMARVERKFIVDRRSASVALRL